MFPLALNMKYEVSHIFFISCADLEPVVVSFEQDEITANEGDSRLVIALEISGSGFDPQHDLGVVFVDGPPVPPCESLINDFANFTYRIAGKFGGELNLAVWQSHLTTTKLNPLNFLRHLCTYGDTVLHHQIKIRQYFYNVCLGPNRQI